MTETTSNPPVILLEQQNQIGWIYLNRPNVLNGINEALAEAFVQAIKTYEADPEIRVIIISGKGKAFCAGGDLKAIQNLKTEAEAKVFVEKAGQMIQCIVDCPKPVMAMINGVAAGAGFNLALACDLIFADENAEFIQSFSNVGLIPDCGGHYFLPRSISLHWSKEVMFDPSPITAFQGLEYGFINQVYCSEFLYKETIDYAKRLCQKAPHVLTTCKKLLNQSGRMTLPEVLAKEAELQSQLICSADGREGVQAFLEKREPKFTGN